MTISERAIANQRAAVRRIAKRAAVVEQRRLERVI